MNLVAIYHGRPGSTLKPILAICHLDVVEAKREDWTYDPFVLTEKDGFFYGVARRTSRKATPASSTPSSA